ncbi:MAG: hypothetical protein OIF38_13520, partial [Cellvibrionaceae bacterium]|nr:hypothetical protein [Cellvibrionaceae bacterium]
MADSALLSASRFGFGLFIARLGGAEVFAGYILLIATNIIFQILPSTAYLMPLLNKGTGALPTVYEALCNWGQRGVERAALVFFLLGSTITWAVPMQLITPWTGFAFILAATAQLIQHSARTRLQMEFKMAKAFGIDFTSCLIHWAATLALWLQGYPLL